MANKEKVCVDKLLLLFTRSVMCQILCNTMDCSTHGFPVLPSQCLSKLMSIESMTPSKHLILCGPLPLSSIFPSIRMFSNELPLCIRCPKYWSFSISASNEYPGLISFRVDCFDLLAVHWDSQESSPTPQFKSINCSMLSIFTSNSHIHP